MTDSSAKAGMSAERVVTEQLNKVIQHAEKHHGIYIHSVFAEWSPTTDGGKTMTDFTVTISPKQEPNKAEGEQEEP